MVKHMNIQLQLSKSSILNMKYKKRVWNIRLGGDGQPVNSITDKEEYF